MYIFVLENFKKIVVKYFGAIAFNVHTCSPGIFLFSHILRPYAHMSVFENVITLPFQCFPGMIEKDKKTDEQYYGLKFCGIRTN